MFFNSTRFAILQICEAPTNQFCADPVGRRHKRNPLSSTSEGFSPQRFWLCLLSTLPSLWGRVLGPGGFYCCDLGLESPFLMWAGGNGTDQSPSPWFCTFEMCRALGKGNFGLGNWLYLLSPGFFGGFFSWVFVVVVVPGQPKSARTEPWTRTGVPGHPGVPGTSLPQALSLCSRDFLCTLQGRGSSPCWAPRCPGAVTDSCPWNGFGVLPRVLLG